MLSAFRICISLYKKIERYGRNSSFNVASRNFMKYVILAVGGPVQNYIASELDLICCMCSYMFSEENVTSHNLFDYNVSVRWPDKYRK